MIKVNAKNRLNEPTLRILLRAQRRLASIVNKKVSDNVVPQRPKKLSNIERHALRHTLMRLRNLCMEVVEAPKRRSVKVRDICTSPSMQKRIASAGIFTLEDMWQFTPAVIAGMIDECEIPGHRTQYHMYLFVRLHSVKVRG
jgi:hypothetical protein